MDQLSSVQRTVLESTKAVPWCLDWSTKRFRYIGPQIVSLSGWSRSSWRHLEDWAKLIHPLDREAVLAFCVKQSELGLDHEADYRMRTAKGSFIWVRDVVHVVRNDSSVDSLVGFIIDISDRTATSTDHSQIKRQWNSANFVAKREAVICDFTPAELQLANALVSGQRAAEYAASRGISISTVRSQIRSLLDKAGVCRQADFIRVLIANQPNIKPSAQLRLQRID